MSYLVCPFCGSYEYNNIYDENEDQDCFKCNDCDNWANRIVAFIKFDPVKVCDDCYFKYYQKFVKRTYR